MSGQRTVKRQPVKLLKNISYPTYQLYAVVNNTKTDSYTALKLAILETLSWVRKRFRDLEIPKELIFPEPDQYETVNIDDFKSFRINEGYVVEVVFIKEKGLWAFNLIEPDLGSDPGNALQSRLPVPGRVFETNVGFKINPEGRLECGFKTVCSEPMGTKEKCEVYRLSVVKNMVRNPMLGLKQIFRIQENPHIIKNTKSLRDFILNPERQMPLVLIAEKKTECVDYEKMSLEIGATGQQCYRYYFNKTCIDSQLRLPSNRFSNSRSQVQPAPFVINRQIFEEQVAEKGNYEYGLHFDAKSLITYKMGFGHFAILKTNVMDEFNQYLEDYCVSNGDIRIIFPVSSDEGSKLFPCEKISEDCQGVVSKIDHLIQQYPKRRLMRFGSVRFINEARLEEQQLIIDRTCSHEEIVRSYENRIDSLKRVHKEKLDDLYNEIDSKSKNNKSLLNKINEIKREAKQLLEQKEASFKAENTGLLRQIERLKKLLDRPTKTEDIPNWVERTFAGKLIFHDKAKDLIRGEQTSETDMLLLCNAIEYLAEEYRDWKLERIDEDTKNLLCCEKYNRPFDVSPSGDRAISFYPEEYMVQYSMNNNFRPMNRALDWHLKVGNDKKMLRIYFFFDDDSRIIVVGSLPRHLKTSV